jgi:hypothetical protein
VKIGRLVGPVGLTSNSQTSQQSCAFILPLRVVGSLSWCSCEHDGDYRLGERYVRILKSLDG